MKFKKLIILLAFCLAACSGDKKKVEQPHKPLLLVSIAPYRTMVEKIAGEEFRVEAVVPPNANPHSYEPTSRQVSGLKDGAIWFQIGEPFEQKLGPLLKETEQVDLRQGVAMIESETHHCHSCGHDHLDRHIWLSPKQAALQAELVASVLETHYPEKKEQIRERAAEFKSRLEVLDREIGTVLAHVEARTFLVSHPAFAYFCRDYNLQQLSVEQEGKDPRPKELEAVYREAIRASAEIAIALPQHNNKGAQLMAERLHIPVRVIDPYSAEYFEMMHQLAELIANPYQTHE